ncbi:MAG: c-type cytochrome [Acidobacteriota bacterium]|nr:c-type cytochrome [Acidobacteriota bacterium]
MRIKVMTVVTGAILTIISGSMTAQNSAYESDTTWKVPESAAAIQNPLAERPETAKGGKKLFLRNCAECHGKDGSGILKKHSANFRLAAVQAQSDGSLFWKITNGNPDRGMPSFSKLPGAQRWQLVLYLRTLQGAPTAVKPD